MSILRVLHGLSERRRGAEVTMASRVPGEIEPWHVFGAEGKPALDARWSNIAGRAPVAYRKDADGFVYLRGTLRGSVSVGSSTVVTLAAFVLPVGYRPLTYMLLGSAVFYEDFGALYSANIEIGVGGGTNVTFRAFAGGVRFVHIYLDGRRHRLR